MKLSREFIEAARAFLLPKRPLKTWITVGLMLALGAYLLFMDVVQGGAHPYHTAIIVSHEKTAELIVSALRKYAADHAGKFPDGKSSTEIFQQLIDENYLGGAPMVYQRFPGKVEPNWGDRLRPENVSWDVTTGLTSNSPDSIPAVFSTGFRVSYGASALATPRTNPCPKLFYAVREVSDWWNGEPDPTPYAAMVVCDKRGVARFIKLDKNVPPAGAIPNFIGPDFKPDGKTYRQLTPEGELK